MSLLDLYRLLLKECERVDKQIYYYGICTLISVISNTPYRFIKVLEEDFENNKPKYNKHTWFWLLTFIPHTPNYWWIRGYIGGKIRINFIKRRIKQLERNEKTT